MCFRSRSRRCGSARTTCPSSSSTSRSEEHTSELQSPDHLVCRLLLEKKKNLDIASLREIAANGQQLLQLLDLYESFLQLAHLDVQGHLGLFPGQPQTDQSFLVQLRTG